MEKRILLFADWYEPGYKAGGPIRSCVNFARNMREGYQIFVFTSDRDLGAAAAYPQIVVDEWRQDKNGVNLYYCSPDALSWGTIKRQIDLVQPDYIYLNSMFSLKFTIFPLLISRSYPGLGVVLSPRGMLRESAIRFKTGKKKIFLRLLRLMGLHRRIRFHATDETEVRDIHTYFGKDSEVWMIPNFPGAVVRDMPVPVKNAGELSIIFVGRIHPIKTLDLLLKVLKGVKSRVKLTIVGSLEDKVYWEKCQGLIGELPASILVEYAGEIANQELPAITAKHHIFALPTQGENFGHAIFEALAVGRPVLISDQTPWRNLQAAGAGWDLPLDHPELFGKIIEEAAAADQGQYERWCEATRQYIKDYIEGLNLKEAYQKLFN